MNGFNPAAVLVDLTGSFLGTPTNVLYVSGSTTVSSIPNVTGSVNVTNQLFNVSVTNQPSVTTTGSLPVTVVGPIPLPVTGSVSINILQKSANATRSSVPGATSSTLVLSANVGRKGAIIYNDSTAILWLGYGSSAVSSADFTIAVASQLHHDVFKGFTGEIRGIWASADGNARVTELT